jgi:ubiquinone/menaquinone biosynthesis C-methylase UbiE
MGNTLPISDITQGSSQVVGPGVSSALQPEVNRYFHERADVWKQYYEATNLKSRIYQARKDRALAWIDELGLPPRSPVLEVGCGAGFTTLSLAQRGYDVTAFDSVSTMLDLTRQAARDFGLQIQVRTALGDVHRLQFRDGEFQLVIALGVLPWLHSPQVAIREIKRVLKPGGYAVMTVDNAWRLSYVLEPTQCPPLQGLRAAVSHSLRVLRLRRYLPDANLSRRHRPQQLDNALKAAGFVSMRGATVGFGPFTFLDRPLLSDASGTKLHQKLQAWADQGIPLLRSMGSHYVVLARVQSQQP